MTRAHRIANLAAVVLPFVAFLAALVAAVEQVGGLARPGILLVMYAFTCFGITIGYHRLLTHRSFETYAGPGAFAVLGTMAVEGPVITWVADHRKHHAFADEEGDPHSPHGHGDRLDGRAQGLVARARRLDVRRPDAGRAEARRYAPDLLKDRAIRVISTFLLWVGLPLLAAVAARLPADRLRVVGGLTVSSGAASCGSSCSTT